MPETYAAEAGRAKIAKRPTSCLGECMGIFCWLRTFEGYGFYTQRRPWVMNDAVRVYKRSLACARTRRERIGIGKPKLVMVSIVCSAG